MEEAVGLCLDLTRNQAFLAIDYLSRTGQIRVTRDAGRPLIGIGSELFTGLCRKANWFLLLHK